MTNPADTAMYTLYGMPASLYTGKPRSYLRKQGIPFVEHAMGSAHFRDEIAKKIGRFIVPVLQTPQGELIQDGTAIIDHFEKSGQVRWSAYPTTPRHRVIALLFELFGGEGLLRPAMHYRWNFPEQNEAFLSFEFGQHLAPGAEPAHKRAIYEFAAGRMKQAAELFGVNEHSIPTIESAYAEFLRLFNAHCASTPYLLGGRPSIGDYGLLAALFAHLGRDPKPADLMRRTAPAVMRWVERMNAPDLDMAEFPGQAPDWFADDQIPPTLTALLRFVAEDYRPEIIAQLDFANDYLRDTPVQEGDIIGGKPNKRSLGRTSFDWRGLTLSVGVFPYRLWLLQRLQDAHQAQDPKGRDVIASAFKSAGLGALLDHTLARRIERHNNCEVWGARRN